jgi:hypothetical protein
MKIIEREIIKIMSQYATLDLVNIQSRLCMVPMGDEDRPKWNASKTGTFFCSDTWNSIRVKENIVD